MNESFNLLDEPWIRVMFHDGACKEVSLLEAFLRGKEIKKIQGEIAPQDVAILRLLIAMAHRTLKGPESLETWSEAWKDQDSFALKVSDYLEFYRDRFDVRDPEQPFFQVAHVRAANDSIWGLEKFIADVPNGYQFFTTRAGEGLLKISWAEASRWLIHAHAYDPSGIRAGAMGDPEVKQGKGYPVGPGWAGQLGIVYIEGGNLLETILLNTVAFSEIDSMANVEQAQDLVPWEIEQPSPFINQTNAPKGPAQCYTWQSRRILLHGDNEGVTGLFFGNGDRANPRNEYMHEAMTAWRYSAPQTKKEGFDVFMPKMHVSNKAFWRGLVSVVPEMSSRLPTKDKEGVLQYKSPGNMQFYASLVYNDLVEDVGYVPIRAVGYEYGSNNSIIVEAIDDALALPSKLLSDEDTLLVDVILGEIKQTELIGARVKGFAGDVMYAQGADPKLTDAYKLKVESAYFVAVDAAFPSWLMTVQKDPENAARAWEETLLSIARDEGEQIVSQVSLRAYSGIVKNDSRFDLGRAWANYMSSLYRQLSHGIDNKPEEGQGDRGDK